MSFARVHWVVILGFTWALLGVAQTGTCQWVLDEECTSSPLAVTSLYNFDNQLVGETLVLSDSKGSDVFNWCYPVISNTVITEFAGGATWKFWTKKWEWQGEAPAPETSFAAYITVHAIYSHRANSSSIWGPASTSMDTTYFCDVSLNPDYADFSGGTFMDGVTMYHNEGGGYPYGYSQLWGDPLVWSTNGDEWWSENTTGIPEQWFSSGFENYEGQGSASDTVRIDISQIIYSQIVGHFNPYCVWSGLDYDIEFLFHQI